MIRYFASKHKQENKKRPYSLKKTSTRFDTCNEKRSISSSEGLRIFLEW